MSNLIVVARPVSMMSWPFQHVFRFMEANTYMVYLERVAVETRVAADRQCADMEKKYFVEKDRVEQLEMELARVKALLP